MKSIAISLIFAVRAEAVTATISATVKKCLARISLLRLHDERSMVRNCMAVSSLLPTQGIIYGGELESAPALRVTILLKLIFLHHWTLCRHDNPKIHWDKTCEFALGLLVAILFKLAQFHCWNFCRNDNPQFHWDNTCEFASCLFVATF